MTEPNLPDLMPLIQRLSRHLSDSPDQAADLAQDCALRLLDRINKGFEIENLRPYAMATLRNLHRQYLRDRHPTEDLTEDSALTEAEGPAQLACRDLIRAVAQLPPEQARLIRLVIEGESSPAALAAQTGVPVGTVMSRLSRARARLRTQIAL